MKLSEALIKYVAWGQFKNKASSMLTYERDLKHLVLYFHNCEIEQVTLEQIIEFLNLMKELGWDLRSFIHKCSAFKQFFKFFKAQGIATLDPSLIPIPQFEPKFPKIIEEVDYKKLLETVTLKGRQDIRNLRNHACLRILWDTGVRIGELRSMRIENLDNCRTVIKTEKSKGIRPMRMIFWTKETDKVLKEYLQIRGRYLKESNLTDEGWLWIAAYGRWKLAQAWSESAIEQMFKQLSVRAKLGFTANPHRFRHHFGRKLALGGANNSMISDMMGHSNINSTRIYTVMNEQMMEDTYRKHFRG